MILPKSNARESGQKSPAPHSPSNLGEIHYDDPTLAGHLFIDIIDRYVHLGTDLPGDVFNLSSVILQCSNLFLFAASAALSYRIRIKKNS